MVFYRKYRPQKIADLDNLDVQQKLYAVLGSNTPHAFLFTGPKGLGKTSTARIIAKAINCTEHTIDLKQKTENKKQKGEEVSSSEFLVESREEVEPCNECDQCISITSGNNLDVLEIDAASNRGIDEIRDLKEKIRLSPVAAKKKVYIIDEVHMLTTEAFNALLKTLEEPPNHAMFILCTTESQKIPATIISRCFHIAFSPATQEELIRSFTRIIKAEKIDITDDALEVVAQLSDRGFRDGAKILEDVALLGQGKKITKELIESHFKTFNIGITAQSFLLAIVEKDVKKSLELIKQLTDQGTDMKYFITYILDMLHKILLLKVGVSEDYKNLLQMHDFAVGDIKILVELFSKAYSEMRYAVLPQLPLELAVIEYTALVTTDVTVVPVAAKVVVPKAADISSKKDEVSDRPKSHSQSVGINDLRKQVGVMQKNAALYGEPKAVIETKEPIEITKIELMKAFSNGEVTKEWQDALWRSLISEMKLHNHTIAGVLRGCTIKSYGNKLLVIEASYKFHKERLDELQNKDALLKICKMLTGNEIQIEVELRNT